jgi:hypothetical protein
MSQTRFETKVKEKKGSEPHRTDITADLGNGSHIFHIPELGTIHVDVNEFGSLGDKYLSAHVWIFPRNAGEFTTLTIMNEDIQIKKDYVETNKPNPHNYDITFKKE